MNFLSILSDYFKEIVITLCVMVIIGFGNKLYIGWDVWPGFISFKRLANEFYGSGGLHFFSSRNSYKALRSHDSVPKYLSQSSTSVIYVGFWLAHQTEIGDIRPTIKSLLESGRKVTIVLMDPDSEVVNPCSKFLGISPEEVKNRINATKIKLMEFNEGLSNDARRRFSLRFHTIPIAASAFLLDNEIGKGARTLVDFKLYDFSRDESFAIEFRNGANCSLFDRVTRSFLSVVEDSEEFNFQ